MTSRKGKVKLEKIEKLLNETGYILRFEKGNFNSGYCVLEHRKVIVINKFLDNEGRFNVLSELIPELKIEKNRISPESKDFYRKLLEHLTENDVLHRLEEQEIDLSKKEGFNNNAS